jgi:hypothetical protein
MTDLAARRGGTGTPDSPAFGMAWSSIIHAMNYRRTVQGQALRSMIEVRDQYNGEMVTPMPDVKGEPDSKQIAPALLNDAVDNLARRAGSLRPQIFCPALDPTKDTGPRSLEYAALRRRAFYASWHYSGIYEVLLRKAFRQYAGYGSWCFNVVPEFREGRARIELRDPLSCYPDLAIVDQLTQPVNIGFMFPRSRAWILDRYGMGNPGMAYALKNSDRDSSDIFDVIEWVDQEAIVIGVLGPRYQSYNTAYPQWPIGGFELKRWVNKAGMVPVSIPYRVTLDKIMGSVNLIVGIVNMMAKMTLLDYFAAEKAVFPDLVIMGRDGVPRLVGNRWKDGREGEPNIIEGANETKFLQSAPGPMSQQTIDHLERAARLTSGNPAMFGGEATGNIRSGQTVSQLGNYSVDPIVQEAQDLMGRSLTIVNQAIAGVEKGYFGAKKQVFFSGWPADDGVVEYVPRTHFETDNQTVRYPYPGTDMQGLTVIAGQLVGAGLMSKHAGRVLHPAIESPELEEHLITCERIDDAMIQSLLQQAISGAMPAIDFAEIKRQVKHGIPIEDAIDAAHKSAQTRQASVPQGPPGPDGLPLPAQGPGGGPPPSAMPGLAMPGAGAESQPAPQIGPVAPSLGNLQGILGALKAAPGGAAPPGAR